VSEQACPQDRWDPFKTESDGDSVWASVDGVLVERMGLSMVRQLGLQSGVAMEVTGRCAETFRLRSDALFPQVRGSMWSSCQ
jgi:hypothetical protein